uniref:Uncharacterized protein n=1 Tax=viral metagenome TaxID=1070528 RepID=A0A6C0L0B3_9ZZZZ
MGRYAFFSTGFEYKFIFGIQSSTDIALYGKGFIDKNAGSCHEWAEADIPLLKEYLEEYVVDWNLYTKSTAGTYTLLEAMHDRELTHDIVLMCVIYHQLLYSCPLTVQYEL